MKKATNKAVRSYLRRVSQLMYCAREERRSRLTGLEQSILEAADQLPFDTVDQVTAHFGPPSAMAEALVDSLPLTEELLRQIRWKAKLRIVVACLAVILACALVCLLQWCFFQLPTVIDLTNPPLYKYGS